MIALTIVILLLWDHFRSPSSFVDSKQLTRPKVIIPWSHNGSLEILHPRLIVILTNTDAAFSREAVCPPTTNLDIGLGNTTVTQQ